MLISGFVLLPSTAANAGEAEFRRTEDVIYGRKFGTALTMDVFAPVKNANGAAVGHCISVFLRQTAAGTNMESSWVLGMLSF